MKDYIKMTSPENERKKIENAVYGNRNGYVDYHLLGDFKVGEKRLKDIIEEQNEEIVKLQAKNEQLVLVMKEINNELKELKGKVRDYGII